MMAETIEAIIREMNAKIVSDHGLKLAMEPRSRSRTKRPRSKRSSAGNPTWPIRWRSKSCRRLADFKGIKLERRLPR